MKESYWGIFVVVMGIIGIALLNAFQTIATTGSHDYYLLKEVTEASMLDALDLGHYRREGEIKIIEEKFVENFLRRFSESFGRTDDREIVFYHINELPPKVSLGIDVGFDLKVYHFDEVDFNIPNNLNAILETKFAVDAISVGPNSPGPFYNMSLLITEGQNITLEWFPTTFWGNPSSGQNYRLEVSCDGGTWQFVRNTGTLTRSFQDTSCSSEKIRYRVRAESDGGVSEWTYSETIMITDHIPPAAPDPFVNPTPLLGVLSGGTINVKWGSTNFWGYPQGNKNYRLEVKYGNNDWTLVKNNGTTINVNYTIPNSISFVEFRVRAESDGGKSAWRYSNIVEVIPFTTKTFTYTGGSQTFTAPYSGTYKLEVWGAQGEGTNGGKGGYSTGLLNLSAGEKLYIYVGGRSGYNGGGIGGYNGGGGTDIRRGGTSLSNRIIVAGGGGGVSNNSSSSGGAGGGTSGGDGTGYYGGPGGGATQSRGGQPRIVRTASNPGTTLGGVGTLGQGGNGARVGSTRNAGGGGGGYYGGAGGSTDYPGYSDNDDYGGGGGSGYIGGVTRGSMTAGTNTGNGKVIISSATP
ncbi:MAG: DUF5411 family protein [Bacilli bacterium]